MVRVVTLCHTSNGIWQTMTQVNPGISKSGPNKSWSQMHLGSRLHIIRVENGSGKVLFDDRQSMLYPDSRYRVWSLECRPQNRIGWTWYSLIVPDSSIGLQSMTQNIKPSKEGQNYVVGLIAHRPSAYPLKAATRSGMLRVCSGSIIPRRGLNALLAIPVLVLIDK